MSQLAKDLQKVEDLITKNGWCRGQLERNGHYCLIGAIAVAVGKSPHNNGGGDPRHDALLYAIADELPEYTYASFDPAGRLWRWNDKRARDKRTVLRLIRRARRRLEEQEAAA